MKKSIYFLLMIFGFGNLYSTEFTTSKQLNKKNPSNVAAIRYNTRSYKWVDLKSKRKIQYNNSTLSLANQRKSPVRFVNAKLKYNYRFQNLENINLQYVVDKNKFYQYTKVELRLKPF